MSHDENDRSKCISLGHLRSEHGSGGMTWGRWPRDQSGRASCRISISASVSKSVSITAYCGMLVAGIPSRPELSRIDSSAVHCF